MKSGSTRHLMKIKLPDETLGFKIYPHTFCGLDSLLIIPGIDPIWTEDNLHFRSLIVEKNTLNVLSCGHKKFFNDGEKSSLYPSLHNFSDVFIEEKKDGSLVIVDFVNGRLSMRTRGSASYETQENANDFKLLLYQYPQIESFLKVHSHLSLLLEIETPNNIIVIRPEKVQFTLLGAINKENLTYVSKEKIKSIADNCSLPIPKEYSFNSLKEMSEIVKEWKSQEGVVVSYNNNQNRIKIKSLWYLRLHRIKSQLNNEKSLIEYYISKDLPVLNEWEEQIEKEFDYEIKVQLKSSLEKISEAGEKTKKYIKRVREFVHEIRNFPSRREIANVIKKNYKENSAIAFCILDNKIITEKQYFDLIKQNL